jgi:hypothetical protein
MNLVGSTLPCIVRSRPTSFYFVEVKKLPLSIVHTYIVPKTTNKGYPRGQAYR